MTIYNKAIKKLADIPPEPETTISVDMCRRIDAGRLDYRAGIGWHDPRGYDPKQTYRTKKALSFTRR